VKRFHFQQLFLSMVASGMLGFTHTAMAAAFQLWEQDGASIGNYHAGRAASAEDASTSYYNPAGLVRIHNQQLVVAVDPIVTNFKFRGTIRDVFGKLNDSTTPAVAQGGGFNVLSALHYAAPLNDSFVFGFSVVSPFGLKTDYGTDATTRYVGTLTSLQIIDVAPSLGFAVNNKLSLGAGLDAEIARGEFDLIAGRMDSPDFDTTSDNVGRSTGYGYHAGILYQINEQTRIGLSYYSKITHHLQGASKFTGELANDGNPPLFEQSNQLKANITLPATTTLSLFKTINPVWDVMGTVSYTQWSVFNQLVLQNIAAATSDSTSGIITVIIPQHYHNTWNYSVGTNYHINAQWMLRGGMGYDQSPSNNYYRNLQAPDSDRIALALGTHYQASKTIGLDMGWTHVFAMNTRIHNVEQTVGSQITTTDGSVRGNADVFGFQVTWDIT